MKAMSKISMGLNLILLGGMIFILARPQKQGGTPAPASAETKPLAAATAPTASLPVPVLKPEPFRWHQLESTNDYRAYIANLRVIGCPEPTIQDIVRGDADRAFAWQRRQLKLDGSGNGPWSRPREAELVASLLGARPAATETAAAGRSVENQSPGDNGNVLAEVSTGTAGTSCPLFLQNPIWSALGFNAEQLAAIAQVRQKFLDQINSQNQNADDPANQNSSSSANPGSSGQVNLDSGGSTLLTHWQTALQTADDQLRDSLGAQGYAAYEQQQYYAWYQPQVEANAGSGNLTINPDAFSLK
jgi:hypothetical protein